MDGSQNMGWGQGMFGEPMEMMCGVYSWGEGWGGGGGVHPIRVNQAQGLVNYNLSPLGQVIEIWKING